MKISQIKHPMDEQAYKCEIDGKELIISSSFGPRVLSLCVDGSVNIFFLDHKKELGFMDFKLYGGHRLWTSPESLDTYEGDNGECSVEVSAGEIKVSSFNESTGLLKSMKICDNNKQFCITHSIENKSDMLYSASLWGLSCVRPDAKLFMPWTTSGEWKMSKIVYWQKWGGSHSSDVNSMAFKKGARLFSITPDGREFKVGAAAHEGFVGASGEGYTLIKKFDRCDNAIYPDDNCAAECYGCADFSEIETLSPIYTMNPGKRYEHKETWILKSKYTDPGSEEGEAQIYKLLRSHGC